MIITLSTMQDNITIETPYTNTEIYITEFAVEEIFNKFSCHAKAFVYKHIELVYYWSFEKKDLNLIETTYFRYNINSQNGSINWNEIDETLTKYATNYINEKVLYDRFNSMHM